MPLPPLLLLISFVVSATANEAFEPGIYVLRCMEGRGKGKYLAFRSSRKAPLKKVAQFSGLTVATTGPGFAMFAASTVGTSWGVAIATVLSITAAASLGSAAAAVVIEIPIIHLLKSDVLVLSSNRRLQFDLQPSEDAPNGFTLKTRITRSNKHGGNFVHPTAGKKRMELQQETAATFVATRAGQSNIYLQMINSESPKWLTAGLKKVKLESERKTMWKLIKASDQSSSISTDGSSIDYSV